MKLLVFAPCEKVIIDHKGNPSLISLMQKITVQIPAGDLEKLPPTAMAPMTWYVFTHWLIEENEMGREFVQRVDVVLPNKEVLAGKGSSITFKPTDPAKNIMQNNVTLMGLPVGRSGPITVNLWVEENGAAITEVHTYPLIVDLVTEEQKGIP